MKPDVSIVLPSYGQKSTILKTLESIYKNKTNLKYEVIVVDSSPEDYTKIVRQSFPNAKVIRLKQRTFPGAAVNQGVMHASSEYILKTDTDVIVAEDWIDKMYGALKDYDIVGGSAGNANPKSILGWAIYLTEFGNFLPSRKKSETTDVMGCNIGFRKSIWKKGNFPNYQSSEDLYFSWQHTLKGAKVLFEPGIRIWHINKNNLGSIVRTQYWIGRTSAWTRKELGIPGKILVRHPLLCLGLPIFRFFSVMKKISREPKNLAIYFLLSPIVLLLYFAYTLGFMTGAVKR